MKRKLLPLLVSLGLVAGVFTVFELTVAAGTQGSCNVTDTQKVHFYENRIGDTSDGDDTLWQCGTSEANFADGPAHTLAGKCKGAISLDDEWNDCISSVTAWIPQGQLLCMYGNANYTSVSGLGPFILTFVDSRTRVNLPTTGHSTLNDGMTSWRFRTTQQGC